MEPLKTLEKGVQMDKEEEIALKKRGIDEAKGVIITMNHFIKECQEAIKELEADIDEAHKIRRSIPDD
jgi:hypothetical protein